MLLMKSLWLLLVCWLAACLAVDPVTHVILTEGHLDRTTIATLQGLHQVQRVILGGGRSLVELSNHFNDAERVINSAGYKYVVEENRELTLDMGTDQWNLDRLDEVDYPLDRAYQPLGTGTGVIIYVLDTGVNIVHNDFMGRAIRDYKDENPCSSDPNARHHGTWVASIASSDTYGVAKRAIVSDVKLPTGASCSFTVCDALAALIWLLSREPPFIVTMAWNTAGFASPCIDALMIDLREHGAFLVAAAGNGNTDNGACAISPARSTAALTVAASATTGVLDGSLGIDAEDERASFSNYGDCIWGFAPGQHIVGASSTSLSATVNMSGTSAAVPHVAGMAAQLVTRFDLKTPDEIDIKLAELAVLNKVNDARGTTNRLLNQADAGVLRPLVLLLLLVCL